MHAGTEDGAEVHRAMDSLPHFMDAKVRSIGLIIFADSGESARHSQWKVRPTGRVKQSLVALASDIAEGHNTGTAGG